MPRNRSDDSASAESAGAARARSRRAILKAGQKPSQGAPPVKRAPRTKAEKLRVASITLERLRGEYPDAHCELDYRNPFELLCATILSAQCTDARVNMVTPALFARYPDAASLAAAVPTDVEAIIRSAGFFRAKTKSLMRMASSLVEAHGGEVPATLPLLTALAGVGRKTANVVLGNAFDINEGIVVDTHVQRVSRRLGLTRLPDPVGIERALVPLFPRDSWTLLSHLMIWHGRRVCFARRPACEVCVLNDVCPSSDADLPEGVAPVDLDGERAE